MSELTMSHHDVGEHTADHCSLAASGDDAQRWSVNDILRYFGPAYLQKYQDRMSLDQIKTLNALSRCRTPAAGSVVFRCDQCAGLHKVLRSCGNRHCPTCQGAKAKDWLQEQQGRLLPCAYFMMTFTVPAEFRPFVRAHPRECYPAIFEAAHQSLVKLAKDPKYLGTSKLGMVAVRHTWGRDLTFHPHVHAIVPGGGISELGTEWLSTGNSFFVPVLALSKLFRAKYKEIMKRCGLLEGIDPAVWSKAWNVNCQAVGDGRESLRYLAPYVFRVAIGNHRIREVRCHEDGTGLVTFMVRPSGHRRYRKMTVTAEEFIRRFLQHVLPTGFQKVRHFGFMHKRSKVQAAWLAMLVTVTLNLVYVLIVTPPQLPARRVLRCPDCGGELRCLGFTKAMEDPLQTLDSS